MKVNGEMIKAKRVGVEMAVRSLAHAADLSERRIQQIEEGDIVNLNRNIAKAIASFLGVKLEVIAATKKEATA